MQSQDDVVILKESYKYKCPIVTGDKQADCYEGQTRRPFRRRTKPYQQAAPDPKALIRGCVRGNLFRAPWGFLCAAIRKETAQHTEIYVHSCWHGPTRRPLASDLAAAAAILRQMTMGQLQEETDALLVAYNAERLRLTGSREGYGNHWYPAKVMYIVGLAKRCW